MTVTDLHVVFAEPKTRLNSTKEINRILPGVEIDFDAIVDFGNRFIIGIGILIKLRFQSNFLQFNGVK